MNTTNKEIADTKTTNGDNNCIEKEITNVVNCPNVKTNDLTDVSGIKFSKPKKESTKSGNRTIIKKAQAEIYRLHSSLVKEAIRNGWIHNGKLRHEIEWCDETANCVTGCSHYSEGCLNCYAERQTPWLQVCHPEKYRNGFSPTLHPQCIAVGSNWGNIVKFVFWNSMSDTFQDFVPDDFIFKMFEFFNNNPKYTFLLLTKRAERLAQLAPYINWTPNIWCGVTVESEKYLYRADLLRQVPVDIKFIAFEPALSSIKNINLQEISLVVAQSESGSKDKIRPAELNWFRELRDLCGEKGTCFFFKGVEEGDDLLDGMYHKQLPMLRKDLGYNPFEQLDSPPNIPRKALQLLIPDLLNTEGIIASTPKTIELSGIQDAEIILKPASTLSDSTTDSCETNHNIALTNPKFPIDFVPEADVTEVVPEIITQSEITDADVKIESDLTLHEPDTNDINESCTDIATIDTMPVSQITKYEQNGMFDIMPINSWLEIAKTKDIPKMLVGELWFEYELCILFSDTNLGKSLLAYQIADYITAGSTMFPFNCEVDPQKVLYFDFELTDKQIECRYSVNYCNGYNFSPNFLRGELNPDFTIPPDCEKLEDYLLLCLENDIKRTGAKIIIVDNITFLCNNNEKAKDALPLMKHLNILKRKYGLSILVLAHITKRNKAKPLTRNDLQGSKMLMNFCDSSFAIGESHIDSGLRYIKQIKQRCGRQLYGDDNVCLFQISKPSNFLMLEFVQYGNEIDHLKPPSVEDKAIMIDEIKELNEKGFSLRKIGEKVGITHMKVKRILGSLADN